MTLAQQLAVLSARYVINAVACLADGDQIGAWMYTQAAERFYQTAKWEAEHS